MENKNYWNLRAKKNKQKIKSTTNFNLIKQFEVSILKYLFEKYLKKKNLNILELGCGNGVNLKSLKSIFPRFKFYGIDYSEEMIKYAKKNSSNINFFLADITNTDILGVKVEIYLSNAVELRPARAIDLAFGEMKNIALLACGQDFKE